MAKSKNKKTTQEDSLKGFQSNHTGLIYLDESNHTSLTVQVDYVDNQTISSDYLNHNFTVRYKKS